MRVCACVCMCVWVFFTEFALFCTHIFLYSSSELYMNKKRHAIVSEKEERERMCVCVCVCERERVALSSTQDSVWDLQRSKFRYFSACITLIKTERERGIGSTNQIHPKMANGKSPPLSLSLSSFLYLARFVQLRLGAHK